jgi:hypothetical protein
MYDFEKFFPVAKAADAPTACRSWKHHPASRAPSLHRLTSDSPAHIPFDSTRLHRETCHAPAPRKRAGGAWCVRCVVPNGRVRQAFQPDLGVESGWKA